MHDERLRILIVDDNRAIHDDFRKILTAPEPSREIDELETIMFGAVTAEAAPPLYQIDSAYQGEEALALVSTAAATGRPYALAFVDSRMPPGWDGIETIRHLWKVDPALQVVICSAFSDYSWADITRRLEPSDGLLILKKPFDVIEAVQLASTLTRKWSLHREVQQKMEQLEATVCARTADLERTNAALQQTMDARHRIEGELRLAQRLEAVGRLASGIAHEINTPVQFASDSVEFVRDVLGSLLELQESYRQLVPALRGDPSLQPQLERLLAEEQRADLDYVKEQVPKAIARALHGLDRVATLVRSMKRFAQPDSGEKEPADLNEAIANTLIIARNEYKYVADVETDFGPLPLVSCHVSEINQVVLGMLVNAAHAVADVVQGTEQRGRISLATRAERADVVISVSDTGKGIPADIRDKIFDPFFSTKQAGRGIGQGLAMARSVIVEKHGGRINFETEMGRGTTFFIRLPIRATAGESP